MDDFTRVKGKNKGKVIIYTLSTCIWCKKTKHLLEELGVEYFYINIDDLTKDLESQYKDELRKWNPKSSYPTIVINDSTCIVGYDEDLIRRELE